MISELHNLLPSALIEDIDKSLLFEPPLESEEQNDSETKNEGKEESNISESVTTISSPLNEKTPKSLIHTFFFGDIMRMFSKQKSTLFIQKLLLKLSISEIAQVVALFKGKYAQVMQDPYGNYFCSDLFTISSEAQRIAILNEISVDLQKLSLNQYGTHPVQTLIKLSSSFEEQCLLIQYINSNDVIIEMCLNPNGTYVIQKILLHFSERLKSQIKRSIIKELVSLSLDMNGVCVVKSLMQITMSSNERKELLLPLMDHFLQLAMSTSGNYALQHALNLWWHLDINSLKEIIVKHFTQLAESRNSSHIAETFISKLTPNERCLFINHLLITGQLALISKSKYGVYVINQVFGFVNWSEREYLVNALKSQLLSSSKAQ